MTLEAAPEPGGVAGQREKEMSLGLRRRQSGCDLPNAGELGLWAVRVPFPRSLLQEDAKSFFPLRGASVPIL